MLALLIIPLLVSGYIVLTQHPTHYYRLHRHDGQLLYMKAATLGLWCFIWTIFFAYLIKWIYPSFHPVMFIKEQLNLNIKEAGSERIIAWIILLSIGSIIVAYVWAKAAKKIVIYRAKIYNYFLHIKIDESDIDYENIVMLRMRQELTKDNPMEEMFFDSLVDRRQIMITLQNKKIYIGIINALGEPNEKEGPNQYISILPILSGYGHKDDLNIVLKN